MVDSPEEPLDLGLEHRITFAQACDQRLSLVHGQVERLIDHMLDRCPALW